MKFKYKKIILLTLISTMGIGVVTLAITPKNHKPKVATKIETQDDSSSSQSATITAAPTLAVTLAPTMSPSPDTLPIYDLEVDKYPDITKLINSYYNAKINFDTKKMKTLLSNTSNVPSKKQMKEDIQFIEGYNKIKCYVKKGYKDGTYIAFVYNEIKFYNIKTAAPAVDQFYIVTDNDGNLKIFSGKYDDQLKQYYNARINDKDVKELLDKTNKKGEKAKKKDKDLKNFWTKLDQSSNN